MVISDQLPAEITGAAFTAGGELTDTVGGRVIVWHVAELQPAAGGAITVTGMLSLALTDQVAITNTAVITAPLEALPDDNTAEAVLQVVWPQTPPGPPPEPAPQYRTYLPVLLREESPGLGRPGPGPELGPTPGSESLPGNQEAG